MKLFALTTAIALGVAAPALAAGPFGLDTSGLTSSQLAQVKAVVDTDDNNRAAKALIERFTAGVTPDVSDRAVEIATIAALTDNDTDNRARDAFIERGGAGFVSTMSTGISAGHQQLADQLGVDASDYSVAELVALKGQIDDRNDPTN